MRLDPLRDDRGQASPEWLGTVLVVSLAFAALVAGGVGVPGVDLAKAITAKLACALDLGSDCDSQASALTAAYGAEVADLVAERVPLLHYEEGMLALPIDWRECREVACAQGPAAGRVVETNGGAPVTLFTHAVDCRDPDAPRPEEASCDGLSAGYLYLQFWAYYPDSQTPPFGDASYHPDDWESFHVRIGPDGVAERASSHHGYNGSDGDPVNDTGILAGKTGWTAATGRYWISSRSHAGRVGSDQSKVRWTEPNDIQLVPLETMRDEWDDYVGSKEHLPAWLKDVYLNPEATGTSG